MVRPTRDLGRLQEAGLQRVGRLRAHVETVVQKGGDGREGDFASGLDSGIAVAIIEMDNLWAGVARSLFLSTAFRGRDAEGRPVTLGIPRAQTTDEALGHAIKRCKKDVYDAKEGVGPWGVGDEPAWGRTRNLLAALDAIGASNYERVSGALSLTPRVFAYVHVFRNFYAHRGKDGRMQVEGVVRAHQLPTSYTPTRALVSAVPAQGGVRPQPLVLDWLDQLRGTIELLV